MKNNSILINQIFPTSGISSYIKNIILVIFGSVLLAVSAKIQVPFWPVPMTMQTFVVFLIGMSYGWKLSFLTLLAYIVEGAFGLPVFATGSGLAYLIGPTSGYIYGMLLASIVIAILSEKGFSDSYFMSLINLLIGSIIIFTLGVGYLGFMIGYEKALNLLIKSNEKKPNQADTLNYLGFTTRKLGDYAGGEKYYLQGLAIEPGHNGINEYLGELYVKTNRINLAKERLKVLENCNCEEYNQLKEIIAGTKVSKY